MHGLVFIRMDIATRSGLTCIDVSLPYREETGTNTPQILKKASLNTVKGKIEITHIGK